MRNLYSCNITLIMDWRLFMWLSLVLACGTWESICSYTSYDLRRSSQSCLRFKDGAGCSEVLSFACVDANTVLTFAPRRLSNLAGMGGPLMMWIPLMIARPLSTPSVLVTTLTWYLSLIGFVRHGPLFTPQGWDPSGHIFVYGSQLVPFWFIRKTGATASVQHVLLEQGMMLWTILLLYLSITTSSFFHTLSESFTGCLLVICLNRMLSSQVVLSDAEAQQLRAELSRSQLCLVVLLWILGSSIGWVGATWRARNVGTLAGELAYDSVLWVWLGWLSTQHEAAEFAPPEAPQTWFVARMEPLDSTLHHRSPSEGASQSD